MYHVYNYCPRAKEYDLTPLYIINHSTEHILLTWIAPSRNPEYHLLLKTEPWGLFLTLCAHHAAKVMKLFEIVVLLLQIVNNIFK